MTPEQRSKQLIACLLKLQVEECKTNAKLELIQLSSGLMPAGKPSFLEVVQYPKISDLVQKNGTSVMLKVVFLMVKDFCNSLNVVRNMNEGQMIESASMLLDECDNFRLEDYVMMFSLAKRGDLVKIYDRIDISVITQMMDEYYLRRKRAGKVAQDEPVERLDQLGNTTTLIETMHPQDAKLTQMAGDLSLAIGQLKENLSVKTNSIVDHGKI